MDNKQRKDSLYSGLITIGGTIFLALILETIKLKNTGFEIKTLWDWMELLLIPLFLAGGAFYLNRSEKEVERKTTEDRAKLETEIAIGHQQEVALQNYIDKMAELMLERDLLNHEEKKARDVARTRTISIMRVLNIDRNNLVIQFLREAKLVIDVNSILNGADMAGMNLRGLNFHHVYLQETNLIGVNLEGALLHRADLYRAHLEEASLRATRLSRVNLEGASLHRADLRGANLQGAIVTEEQLEKAASLEGATMPDGLIHE